MPGEASGISETTIPVFVRFRPCRESDLEALEWMGLHTREREIITETFAAQVRGDALMLLAEAGGFPVAQAWLDFAERGTAEWPHLWAVRVFPPLQGAGLGRRLMAEAEVLAAARGAHGLELGVEWDNARARRFYRSLGYSPTGARRDLVRYTFDGQPLEMDVDQQIMRKDLARAGARARRAGASMD